MATTMKLIGKQTLGSSAASVTFSSLPQNFDDLAVIISARQDRAATNSPAFLQMNGSSTGYSNRVLYYYDSVGARSATNEYGITTYSFISQDPGASTTSSTFGSVELLIPNYSGASNKAFTSTAVHENNSSANFAFAIYAVAGLWSSTAAITSLTFYAGTPVYSSINFVANSSWYLYGIKRS